MGFLDSILGHHKDHPPLDDGSVAARRLETRRQPLEAFVAKVHDRLELVPDADAVYVFIGRPPDTFGIAWLTDGAEHNLKTLIQARGLAPASAQAISERLREVYEAHRAAERRSATIAGKKVTVTQSDAFAADVRRIVLEVER
jgi:hypothetical protein